MEMNRVSHHMSSVLHLYACVCVAILLASIANRFLSKPFDRSTPSQRYPGRMLNLLGGGSGPLYTGFSEKRETLLNLAAIAQTLYIAIERINPFLLD